MLCARGGGWWGDVSFMFFFPHCVNSHGCRHNQVCCCLFKEKSERI